MIAVYGYSPSGYGIAEIVLYADTHCAEGGGIELVAYPALRAWLARIGAQSGFVPMPRAVRNCSADPCQSRKLTSGAAFP
ncbi:hypothetical protein [Dokdonella sp.]|uniref:hypothetical protein n=1 Tax=Dokdonella sp. TaxID=2291710 RepID=UPI0025BB9D4F|nr:hypothetical protein [Dokdonella sp.]MBX3689087.1 hypothetical protein [Dokdonella sp.]